MLRNPLLELLILKGKEVHSTGCSAYFYELPHDCLFHNIIDKFFAWLGYVLLMLGC